MSGKAKMWGAAGILFIVMMPVLIMPTIGITLFGALLGDDNDSGTTVESVELSDFGFSFPAPGSTTVKNNTNFMNPEYKKACLANFNGKCHNHSGIDLANSDGAGKPVVAPFTGKVVLYQQISSGGTTLNYCAPQPNKNQKFSGGNTFYEGGGNTIVIMTEIPGHPNETVYMGFNHLANLQKASCGDVSQNEQLGTVGQTGNATGPHLHVVAGYHSFIDTYGTMPWDTPIHLSNVQIVDPLWFFQGMKIACETYPYIYKKKLGSPDVIADKPDDWIASTVACKVE